LAKKKGQAREDYHHHLHKASNPKAHFIIKKPEAHQTLTNQTLKFLSLYFILYQTQNISHPCSLPILLSSLNPSNKPCIGNAANPQPNHKSLKLHPFV